MIRSLVEWALQFRMLVIVISLVLLFFGTERLRDMPVDVYPEFAPVTVEVHGEALGLSAQEVAELVTVPLEADLLSNVPWVDIIRSESVPGLSSIELIFEPGTDLLEARQVVQERLSEAVVALPGASKAPRMLQPRSSMTRVMMIGLSSRHLSLIEMSVLARWNIGPRLMGVPGVANVAIWGQREQQLQVQVDPAKLQAERVPLLQIIESTANALWASNLSFVEASVPGTGGFIDTPNQRIGVQHISPITSAAALAQVPLEERPVLRLGELATVVEDYQPLIGDAIINSGPGLLLVIEKWPEASTLEVTRDVEDALKAMAPGLAGVEIVADLYRPASYIEEGMNNLTIAMIVAGVLVILILAVFLYDWRTVLIGALTIPMAFFAAVLALDALGETLNLMVVAGLALALVLVIDDVVIVTESIWRRLRQPRAGDESTATIIRESLVEAQGPLVFAMLVMVLTVLPLFFLQGIAGAFFPPVVLAYIVAAVASAVVAMTIAPALALILFPNLPGPRRASPVASWLQDVYAAALSRTLSMALPAFAVAGVVVLVGLGLLSQVNERSLLPPVRERDILIHLEGAPGTSQQAMTRVLTLASQELQALPGVRSVGAHTGRAIASDQVVGINSSEIWINIEPDADYAATVEKIDEIVNGYAGFSRALLTYPEKRVREVLTGSPKDLVVRLYGEELTVLRQEADAVRAAMAQIDGVIDPQIEQPLEEPTIEIQVDIAAAQRAGIKPGDVRRAATTLLSGLQVGSLFEEQKVFEVVVWSTPQTRNSVNSIGDLLIDTPFGTVVRLADVAEVRVVPNPSVVKRESVSRYIDVTADVAGRSVGSVEDEVTRSLKNLSLPSEYHAEVVTDKAGGVRVIESSLVSYVVAAAIGVYLLLQAAFSSWRLATLSFFVLPAGLVGGVMAAVVDGGDLNIGSYMGFVAVLGISVRNALALFSRYQAIEQEGKVFDADMVLRGARERFCPVIATALATALALLPFVVFGSISGLEVIRPMAVVILGGLITSTALALFLLPALYVRYGRRLESTSGSSLA